MKMLRENNYQAYLVGGVVRDILLQREVCDFEIVADALQEKIMEFVIT